MKPLIICALLLSFLLPAEAHASGKSYKDSDWSVSMIDNCGFPVAKGENASVTWVRLEGEKKLRFTLREGERGKCPSDNKARHRAPYWERAELRQNPKMRVGTIQQISFEAIFVEGFQGDRETFFQIHAWNEGCAASPLVMMKSLRGRLGVWALHKVSGDGLGRGGGKHKDVQKRSVAMASLYGKKSRFVIELDTTTMPGRLSVFLNDQPIVSNASVSFAPCAAPHVKMGIYRPGGKGSGTSTIILDKLKVVRSK